MNKKCRIYISGPISGTNDYMERFGKAQLELLEQGYEVFNPACVGAVMLPLTYEEYMRLDLHLMDLCEAVYMLKGWQNSKGANREYGYALAKDKLIIFEEGDL